MEVLDLHGIRHCRVALLVENFILLNPSPVRIITGNSSRMKSLTIEVVERYGFSWGYENDYNLGAIAVNAS